MPKQFDVVISEDGRRFFLLYQRGRIWFAVGVDDETWTSRFEPDEIPNAFIRKSTADECKVIIDKLIKADDRMSDDADGY
jgi:hypothetical protein